MSRVHDLKIDHKYYMDVMLRYKRFEYRKDDRDYKVGDIIVLHEVKDGMKTGRKHYMEIIYILRNVPEYGLPEGYCVLGLG